jgi:hypothetical protein
LPKAVIVLAFVLFLNARKHVSNHWKLVKRSWSLARDGFKELILIAQDLTLLWSRIYIKAQPSWTIWGLSPSWWHRMDSACIMPS